MIDDSSALPALWTSNESADDTSAASTIAGVLEKDRAERDRSVIGNGGFAMAPCSRSRACCRSCYGQRRTGSRRWCVAHMR
jgi:hypothetical protein